MAFIVACVAGAFATPALAADETRNDKATASKSLDGIVVLPVLPQGNGPKPQAAALRRALRSEGATNVLDLNSIRTRLAPLAQPAAAEISAVKKKLDDAEEAFAAFDAPRSLALLDEVIATLAADLDVSEEKRVLLEEVRMKTVRRTMGTADPSETGRGETPQGLKARALLVDMLRQNPRLNLSPERFPPKLRRLLEGARTELAGAGLVGLAVESIPQQAQVFVEGRVVGLTPLRLPQALAPGRYRIWVAKDGQRSAPRVVDVADAAIEMNVDLAFESAVDAEMGALTPTTSNVPEALAFRVGTLTRATQLILVGVASYDGAQWLYGASFDPAKKETTLRGAVRLDPIGVTDATTRKLAVFLAKGTPKELNPTKVPLTQERVELPPVATAEEGAGLLPWALAGGASAAVVVATVVTAAVVTAVVIASQPPGVRIVLEADQ